LLAATLQLPESHSLKDKRHIVKSLCDTLRARFNCAAAQIDTEDRWQTAEIAVCVVANERRFVDEMLNKIANKVESDPRYSVTRIETEVL
jgi:hypothetical protein